MTVREGWHDSEKSCHAMIWKYDQMNVEETKKWVNNFWDESIIPTLMDYIRIPNKSPLFDSKWQEHGYMEAAVKLLTDWCQQNALDPMKLEVVRLSNRTPVIFIEIPGQSEDTILLYGHLDKQPEMIGWSSDLGPWKPVLKEDKLYGRGSADDGYALFTSLAAIKALREQHISHARCVILIEACEESGSYDLPYYIELLEKRLGKPNLILCLDSGCGNYDQLWVTTSLRGLLGGILSIEVLKEGVHSGSGSGVVPSCFMILRQLLNRIEKETTGEILLSDLFVDIPNHRLEQAKATAKILGDKIYTDLPYQEGVKPLTNSSLELLLNRTWRPALSIIGSDGLPLIENAGNVTLPWLKVKLSMRLPPTCDANTAGLALKKELEKNPPHHAKIKFELAESGTGWNAPKESPWLIKAANEASNHYFGKNEAYIGEGGSIPFMGMLGRKFPEAEFLITGVLGPESNAHGPNEFLHIPTGKKLTSCVAEIIANHHRRNHG